MKSYISLIIFLFFVSCKKSADKPTVWDKINIEETNRSDTLPILWDSSGILNQYIIQW